MRLFPFLLLLLSFVSSSRAAAAETFIVQDGQPRAQIVIAKDPRWTTQLAAHELQ